MRMAMADRISAIVFLALGVAMFVGGYTMDRLEIRQIHPLSIPGMMPMLLGIALSLSAIGLYRQAKDAPGAGDKVVKGGSPKRLAISLGLTLIYALVLAGWMPFFWATALFVAAFAAVFSWPEEADAGARAKAVGLAVIFGLLAAWGVTTLFETAFLVRLP